MHDSLIKEAKYITSDAGQLVTLVEEHVVLVLIDQALLARDIQFLKKHVWGRVIHDLILASQEKKSRRCDLSD